MQAEGDFLSDKNRLFHRLLGQSPEKLGVPLNIAATNT
jgi:hypothetical protein